MKKIALVIIDVVNSCCHEKCETKEYGITYNKIRKMVPRLEKFIGQYRSISGESIIFVNLMPWTKEYLPQNIQQIYEDPNREYYGKGDFEQEFYLIEPTELDKVITKNTYDAFANPEFEKFLRQNKIDTIAITGVFTDGCVMSTIISGFSKGYNFIILEDLVETTDMPIRQRLQHDLLEYTIPMQYGKVMNSKKFIETIKD